MQKERPRLQRFAGLRRLKLVAMGDERTGIAQAEDASVEPVLGDGAVDFFVGCLEVRQRPALIVEVIGIDRRDGAGLLGENLRVRRLQLKLAGIENPWNDELAVDAKQLEFLRVGGLQTLQRDCTKLYAALNLLPLSRFGDGERSAEVGSLRGLGKNLPGRIEQQNNNAKRH